jgi:hypothetical protein
VHGLRPCLTGNNLVGGLPPRGVVYLYLADDPALNRRLSMPRLAIFESRV